MHRDERRRRFHDGLLKMLYPPLSPPSQLEDGDQSLGISLKGLDDVDPVTDADDLGENATSASSDDEECAPQKLTRAQRKRLHQKKLKENASRRRKIIGPELPSPSGGDIEDKTPEIPHNAADESVGAIGKPAGPSIPTCVARMLTRAWRKKLCQNNGKKNHFPLLENYWAIVTITM